MHRRNGGATAFGFDQLHELGDLPVRERGLFSDIEGDVAAAGDEVPRGLHVGHVGANHPYHRPRFSDMTIDERKEQIRRTDDLICLDSEDIVLIHDRPETTEMFPQIIERLLAKGIHFRSALGD